MKTTCLTTRAVCIFTLGIVLTLMLTPAHTASAVSATGGTTTTNGGYIIHAFTTSGTFTVTAGGTVDVLVVGGGGGGGGSGGGMGGGGGAGAVTNNTGYTVISSNYTVTVGAGGIGGSGYYDTANHMSNNPANGSNSVFGSITAVGGGYGGSQYGQTPAGGTGASGGGGVYGSVGGAGTQGYNGGTGSTAAAGYGGGGGGGASAAGGHGSGSAGGAGGTGTYFSAFQTWGDTNHLGYFGGGGGGSKRGGADGDGGVGGWGGGGVGGDTNGFGGQANTGAGGGGADYGSGAIVHGGNGGSGIVIVRYPYDAGSPTIANAAATNVAGASANLNGYLTSTGTAPITAVAVYWGTNDGLSVAGNWGHTNTFSPTPQVEGPLTTNIQGLTAGILYYYRYYVTNGLGEGWASSSTVFIPTRGVAATGGTITNDGVYLIHTFTNSGTFTVATGGKIDVLVVAGGGGGGNCLGGGGGAGGLVYNTNYTVTNGSVTVTVGAGGAGGIAAAENGGFNGSNSVFGSLTAYGGGGGAGWSTINPQSGGSGGGGHAGGSGAAGIAGQGKAGGNGAPTGNYYPAGGGGGSGGTGGSPVLNTDASGNGGAGLEYAVFASVGGYPAGWFAGGGAGGSYLGGPSGTGGTGGGGNGGVAGGNNPGSSGQANTGGGGGAGAYQTAYSAGGSGGSGIVIVRYDVSGRPAIANLAASSLTPSSADLNGYLTSTGAASMVGVTVYWGTNDGQNVAGNWGHTNTFSPTPQAEGPLTTNITGLVPSVVHYYTYYATNSFGEGWASPSASFLVPNFWYVSTSGSDTNAGTSWVTSFLTVSNAVAHVRDGDTVLVSNGTYNLAVSSPIMLTNAVTLLGVGGASNTFLRGPYPSAGRVLYMTNAAAIVDGFTITNGSQSLGAGADIYGAGVYMTAGILRNCTVAGNIQQASGNCFGGGIYAAGGLISNCIIRANIAESGHLRVGYGGGMFMSGGLMVDSRVERNLVKGSPTGWGGQAYGGGVFMNGGRVWNCLFFSNTVQRTAEGGDWNNSWGSGGGIYVGGGSVVHATVADNVCVSNNPTGGVGAGIYQSAGAVTNTIAYFNQTAGVANDFFSGGGAVVYSCAPELSTGAGNLTGNPQFVNRAGGDYRIGGASVCVDAGTNVPGLPVDLGLNARPQDGDGNSSAIADMGCYEFVPGQVLTCNFSTTNAVIGVNVLSNVLFRAIVTGPPGSTNVTYYWWNFGTGTTPQEGATLSNAVNTFGPGIYDITLTISNSLGQITNAVQAGYIQVTVDTTFVATNGSHVFPYNTWSRAASNPAPAFAALVQAFNNGAAAGSMWVSNGTYTLDAQLNMSYPVRVQSMGGASNTILRRGTFQHRLLFVNHAAALVDGFTVTNGYLAENPSYGGGIYVGTGTVRNCIITGNGAYGVNNFGFGGGLYLGSGYASNLVIMGNTAQGGHFNHGYGGGMYVASGTAMNCRVEGNTARGSMTGYGGNAYGGGLYVAGGQVLNVFAGSNRVERRPTDVTNWNVTYGWGGGVYIGAGSLVNATVVDNLAVSNNPTGRAGGGLYQAGGTAANCIVYYNLSNAAAPGPDNYLGAGAVYSCAPELTSGVRNVTAPPQFRILGSGFDYTTLLGGSPCRNTGTNQAWMYFGQDLGGGPRLAGNTVDMGAYEAAAAGTVFIVH